MRLSSLARVERHRRSMIRYSGPLRRTTALHSSSGSSREDVVGQRRLDDPRLLLELRLELARRPSPRSRRTRAPAGYRPTLVGARLLGQEADRPERDDLRAVRMLEVGQDDRRLRLDRPADEQPVAAGDELGERRRGLGHGRPRSVGSARRRRRPPRRDVRRARPSGGSSGPRARARRSGAGRASCPRRHLASWAPPQGVSTRGTQPFGTSLLGIQERERSVTVGREPAVGRVELERRSRLGEPDRDPGVARCSSPGGTSVTRSCSRRPPPRPSSPARSPRATSGSGSPADLDADELAVDPSPAIRCSAALADEVRVRARRAAPCRSRANGVSSTSMSLP